MRAPDHVFAARLRDASVQELPAIAFELQAEANELTNGARQSQYGHPLDDFTATAQMWSAWLSRKYGPITLEAEDVGWLMVLLKISREGHRTITDNLRDAYGYLNCVEMIRSALNADGQ